MKLFVGELFCKNKLFPISDMSIEILNRYFLGEEEMQYVLAYDDMLFFT